MRRLPQHTEIHAIIGMDKMEFMEGVVADLKDLHGRVCDQYVLNIDGMLESTPASFVKAELEHCIDVAETALELYMKYGDLL